MRTPDAVPIVKISGNWAMLFNLAQQVHHLYGAHSCVRTFVAALGAGPFHGLLNGIRGQDAKGYGQLVL